MSPVLLAIVALALWLGAAALVAGVVAPAAFAVLPTRTLAGALVGRVLPVVFWSGIGIGVLAALMVRDTGGMTLGGLVIMVLGCAVAQFVISPRIERIRAAIGGPIDALALTEPRRADFGRLHGLSVLAMGIAGVGALVALVMLLRIASTRNPT